jgi:hypothetical protein
MHELWHTEPGSIPKPSGVTHAETLSLVRTVSRSRYREVQPAFNQPRQDTIPGADSATE